MQIIEKYIISENINHVRLSDYAFNILQTVNTKSALKKAIKKQLILVNGKHSVSGQFVNTGDVIELLADENQTKKDIHLSLTVIYEDDYLAAIYKPAGILVSGNKAKTITNALVHNLSPSHLTDAVKPQPVHRLDFPTSGILLIGKTSESIQVLNQMFEYKKIQKTYYAITQGKMNTEGIITDSIEDKTAKTHYSVLQNLISERYQFLNLVKLVPETGKRHQLRIHCANMGTPILGDLEYTPEHLQRGSGGLYLHAYQVDFIHPFTQEKIILKAEIPKKFSKLFTL